MLAPAPASADTLTFSNSSGITANDSNPVPTTSATLATPYPSTIALAGVGGSITKATVTLTDIDHGLLTDLEVLLVAPGGQKDLLISAVGPGAGGIADLNLTFDDAGGILDPMCDANPLSGTYDPRDCTGPHVFPAPAPAGPYAAGPLSVFNGASPNGTWSLYIVDWNGNGNDGTIASWSLTLSGVTPPVIPPVTPLTPVSPTPSSPTKKKCKKKGKGAAAAKKKCKKKRRRP